MRLIPIAQYRVASQDRHTVIVIDMRCRHTEDDATAKARDVAQGIPRTVALGKEITYYGEVAPYILKIIRPAGRQNTATRHGVPLLPAHLALTVPQLIGISHKPKPVMPHDTLCLTCPAIAVFSMKGNSVLQHTALIRKKSN